jgi:hypothetical protein
MVSDLEACNAGFRAAYPAFVTNNVCASSPTTSTTAPSAAQDVSLLVPVADSDNNEHEVEISGSSKLTATSSVSPRSSPTPTPPLDFSLSIYTTNSDEREHEVTSSNTKQGSNGLLSIVHIFPNLGDVQGDDHANPTISNLVMATSTSPTPSPTYAPSQDKALDFQFGVTKLLIASPTRYSILNLYRASLTFSSDEDSKLQTLVGTTKHLLLLHAKYSMLDTTTQDIINNHTAMVESTVACLVSIFTHSQTTSM